MSNPQHPQRAEDYDDDVQRAEDFGTDGPEDQLGRARPKQGGGTDDENRPDPHRPGKGTSPSGQTGGREESVH